MRKMKYLNQCTDEQIKELMGCYSDKYTDIDILRRDDCIDVTLEIDGIPENYLLMDYEVVNYDWDDSGESCLHDYRQKMLGYFGSQYAVDFLLDC